MHISATILAPPPPRRSASPGNPRRHQGHLLRRSSKYVIVVVKFSGSAAAAPPWSMPSGCTGGSAFRPGQHSCRDPISQNRTAPVSEWANLRGFLSHKFHLCNAVLSWAVGERHIPPFRSKTPPIYSAAVGRKRNTFWDVHAYLHTALSRPLPLLRFPEFGGQRGPLASAPPRISRAFLSPARAPTDTWRCCLSGPALLSGPELLNSSRDAPKPRETVDMDARNRLIVASTA